MKLFGKKKPASSGEPSFERMPPISEVQALSSRGVSEPEIIGTLRREGYTVAQIDHAMKEALKSRASSGFEPPPMEPMMPPPASEPSFEELTSPRREFTPPSRRPVMPDFESTSSITRELSREPTGNDFIEHLGDPGFSDQELPEPRPMQPRARGGGMNREQMQELAEVIIQERMGVIEQRFVNANMMMKKLNSKMEGIEAEMNKIRSEKSGELREIETKIDSYRQSITSLNAKMDSMERALKDSLSPMLESLRSLSDTIRELRSQKKQ